MKFAKSFNRAPLSLAVACALLTPAALQAQESEDMVEVIEVLAVCVKAAHSTSTCLPLSCSAS